MHSFNKLCVPGILHVSKFCLKEAGCYWAVSAPLSEHTSWADGQCQQPEVTPPRIIQLTTGLWTWTLSDYTKGSGADCWVLGLSFPGRGSMGIGFTGRIRAVLFIPLFSHLSPKWKTVVAVPHFKFYRVKKITLN